LDRVATATLCVWGLIVIPVVVSSAAIGDTQALLAMYHVPGVVITVEYDGLIEVESLYFKGGDGRRQPKECTSVHDVVLIQLVKPTPTWRWAT
jgi:hypothetical protein